jgi:hypothetical protein
MRPKKPIPVAMRTAGVIWAATPHLLSAGDNKKRKESVINKKRDEEKVHDNPHGRDRDKEREREQRNTNPLFMNLPELVEDGSSCKHHGDGGSSGGARKGSQKRAVCGVSRVGVCSSWVLMG